jgi:hypothetical protein
MTNTILAMEYAAKLDREDREKRMGATPKTDAHKSKMPSGISDLSVAVWVANQNLEFARTLERQNAELLAAAKEVLRISDRKHDAWDRLREAIRRAEA